MNSIEPLEPRIAPAVVVAVSHGVLNIDHTASSSADALLITETGPGTFAVSDTVAMTAYGTFDNVTAISVKLGETDDSVTVQCSSDGLAGKLKIATGAGTNSVNLSGGNVAGFIGGAVSVTGDAGADTMHLSAGLILKGTLTFDGKGGTDYISGDNFTVAKTVSIDNVEQTTFNPSLPVVFGALVINQDEAASAVVFNVGNNVTVTGKLTYCGSPTQDDDVTLTGQFDGPVLEMLNAGTNNVHLAGLMSSTLTITGGSGADTVDFTDSSSLGSSPNHASNVAKAVKLNLGGGNNTVTVEKAAHFDDSLSLTTGMGNDTINFGDFSVKKDLKLTVGSGTNTVAQQIGSHVIGNAFKYVGGAGDDNVAIDGIMADTLSIKLGDGANGVTGTAGIVGNSASITGGAGVDTLDFGINGSVAILSVKLGAAQDKLTYTGGTLAGAKLDGGADLDTLVGTSLLPVTSTFLNFETKMP